MFQKEGSFINTKGNTPLKKSIRRKLRDDFLTSIIPKNVNTDHIKDLIDFIFIDSKSEVSIRKLKRKDTNSNAGATNIYSRTSSPSSSDDLKYWPYTKFSQVLMLEAGRDYDPVLETPMFNTAAQAPLRGVGTPDKDFGFYDATVDGGWEVPGEPYTTAEGTEFLWWRVWWACDSCPM